MNDFPWLFVADKAKAIVLCFNLILMCKAFTARINLKLKY